MSIEQNVADRGRAGQVYDLAVAEARECNDGERFWEELDKQVGGHVERPEQPRARPRKMTDDEARRFGSWPVPFGEFVGRRVDDVPMERLRWYADQNFIDRLRRYLESDRIKGETSDG